MVGWESFKGGYTIKTVFLFFKNKINYRNYLINPHGKYEMFVLQHLLFAQTFLECAEELHLSM